MALVLDGDSGIVGVLATNADGDVIIDTNTFFVDAVTNRVGIGTTTPESTLHVNGNIRTDTGPGYLNLNHDGVNGAITNNAFRRICQS